MAEKNLSKYFMNYVSDDSSLITCGDPIFYRGGKYELGGSSIVRSAVIIVNRIIPFRGPPHRLDLPRGVSPIHLEFTQFLGSFVGKHDSKDDSFC